MAKTNFSGKAIPGERETVILNEEILIRQPTDRMTIWMIVRDDIPGNGFEAMW